MKQSIRGTLFLLIMIVGFAWWAGSTHAPAPDTKSDAKQEPTKPEKISDEECIKDIECWGKRNYVTASVFCQEPIERMAKHSVEWTDRWLQTKVSGWSRVPPAPGAVTYIGDRVKFQNGFGAWSPMIYECDFDPVAQRVLAVRVREGRLEK
jgi:hypothetical protein